MRRIAPIIAALLLAACATAPPAPQVLAAWPERLRQLQSMPQWDLQGRAAAAVGTQGWQANLAWHQGGQDSEIHLAGPLGVGAMALKLSEQGVEIEGRGEALKFKDRGAGIQEDGAERKLKERGTAMQEAGVGPAADAPTPNATSMPDAVTTPDAAATQDAAAYLAQRLGFAPPFARLRYWLLGVPSPELPFEWQSNAQDRALSILQDGWRIEYPDYMRVGADLLPRHMTLTRDTVRVRVAVDRWTLPP